MRGIRAFLTALLGIASLWLAPLATAQEGTYRLQPDDLIRIQVYNEAQVDAQIPVGKDGNVSAPFVGIIRVVGRTTAEVEAELAQLYQQRLRIRDPKVSVTILRFRVLRATVGGLVLRPGTYDIRPGDTLVSLLNLGGGAGQGADLRKATLRRNNSRELIPIDLSALLLRADTSQNYELQDGDELLVPEGLRTSITIYGAVQRPGSFPYREDFQLSDAIGLAQGEIPGRTKFSEITIIRQAPGVPGGYLQIRADYVRFIRKGDWAQNVMLRPGDIIFVPQVRNPNIAEISNTLQTVLFVDRIFRDGVFGFRLFR